MCPLEFSELQVTEAHSIEPKQRKGIMFIYFKTTKLYHKAQEEKCSLSQERIQNVELENHHDFDSSYPL